MKTDLIININFTNWEQYINDGLVLVDFWAPWCTACIAQDKIYEELIKLFSDKLKICKIDISDNRVLAEKFRVRNIPFLILMNNGRQVIQLAGIESKEYLISQIKKQII